MLLNLNELKDKDFQGANEVLAASFEYLLAGISQEYCSLLNFKTYDEFNKKNDLDLTKILSYPFFISLANGHSNSLFNLFGDFYNFGFGPASLELNKFTAKLGEVSEYSLHFFKYAFIDTHGVISPNGLQVVNVNEYEMNFEVIKNSILDRKIQVKNNEVQFRNIEIKSDFDINKTLFSGIDSGIKAISIQSERKFFVSDIDAMKFHASYFNLLKNHKKGSSKIFKIEFSDVQKVENRPFYLSQD